MKYVQKALVKKGSTFLILRRHLKSTYYPGFWDFPGGKVNKQENLVDSIQREVYEETKLEVNVVKKIGTYNVILEDNSCLSGWKLIVYEVESSFGEVKLSKEHIDFKWIDKKRLLGENLEYNMRYFLQKYLEMRF